MISNVLGAIINVIGLGIDKAVTDKDEAARLKTEITSQILQLNRAELDGAVKVITAEAQGESWLQRSWRPITMVVFVSLLVAHFLGFTAENISPSEIELLMEIIQVGIGGYVVGRSAEKVMKAYKDK